MLNFGWLYFTYAAMHKGCACFFNFTTSNHSGYKQKELGYWICITYNRLTSPLSGVGHAPGYQSSGQKFNFQNCLITTWNNSNLGLEGVFVILKAKFFKGNDFWHFYGNMATQVIGFWGAMRQYEY